MKCKIQKYDITFTEEILNGKLHFLCTVWSTKGMKCIYETFLHSSTSFDGFNVQIPQRSFRKDYLSNNKHVWVLIHYKIFLLIQKIDIASSTEIYVLILKLEEKHEDFWPFLDPYSSVLNCKGVGQIAFLKYFSLLKAFYHDPPKLRNFRESPTPLLITISSFSETSW